MAIQMQHIPNLDPSLDYFISNGIKNQHSSPIKQPFYQQNQQIRNCNYSTNTKHDNNSSSILSDFVVGIQDEITQKIMKKLKIEDKDREAKLLITMCQIIDTITDKFDKNINATLDNLKNSYNELISSYSQIQIEQNQKITNKMNTLQNQQLDNTKAINSLLNQQQQQNININNKLNNIKQQTMKHQKSFDVLIKQQQQQQQLQNNSAQDLKKITFINHQQNKKIDVVQNQINLMNTQIKNGNNKIQQTGKKLSQFIESNESSSLSSSVSIQSLRFALQKIQDTLNNIKFNEKQSLKIIDDKSTNNKYIRNLNNNLSQINTQLKDTSSKINNFNGGIISVLSDVSSKTNDTNINKQMIITQKVIMKNINKIKKDLHEFNTHNIKKQLNNLCVKFNKLESSDEYMSKTINESNTINEYGELNFIALIDDYINLHNDFDNIYDERLAYHTQLININNIITEHNIENNIMKDKIIECLNIKEKECNYLLLLSNDFVKYKINKNIAMLSDLIKTMYEGDNNCKSIIFARLSSNELKFCINYMEYKYMNQNIDISDEFRNCISDNLELNDKNFDRYRNIAKYLGIKPLLKMMNHIIQLIEQNT